eukprot:gnl/MRDRNA2_/MRDRNA2_251484_c0_seq1.p1 gnl/MRDRNA2_/MRDRNA2_251484_c0~~gnl/MRDRNA2_/MRDRNA2_251484_c0_seq1.p1  ORF type:complete len:228 (-),score=48.02 gnl/MRDRNA2_/MRDRNA2_251484_c0_seq1:184-780(-)
MEAAIAKRSKKDICRSFTQAMNSPDNPEAANPVANSPSSGAAAFSHLKQRQPTEVNDTSCANDDTSKSSKPPDILATLFELSDNVRKQLEDHAREMKACVEHTCRAEFARLAESRNETQGMHPGNLLLPPAGRQSLPPALKETVRLPPTKPGPAAGGCALLGCSGTPSSNRASDLGLQLGLRSNHPVQMQSNGGGSAV